jgi:GNAT superfamily N-acetyltransferase
VLRILRVETGAEEDHWQELVREFFEWAVPRAEREFGIRFDVAAILAQEIAQLAWYAPPGGCRLLAEWDGQVVGCAALRRLDDGVGEVMRVYVRPAWRGRGVGRALLDAVIEEARQAGYCRLRLDSARFMVEAHSLYRSMGFQETDPYAETEIPPEHRTHWLFMEKQIA